jgi:hypothetical protein
MRAIGDRVGTVFRADEDTVYLLGFGVFEGYFVPPASAGGFNFGIPNPRIRLDGGKEVFGCECWWGGEKEVKKMCEGRKVVAVDIDTVRAESARAGNEQAE